VTREEYECTFIEEKRGQRNILYRATLSKNTWMKLDVHYIGNFFVEARNNKGVLKHRISFLQHLRGKRVFITFGSSSLGDTIAWIPYCLEFKKKYQCDVIVSTFKNFLFKDVYPELELNTGYIVENIIAMPELGWHWDKDKEPVNPITIPLQQSACNILHLPYKEMRPRIIDLPGVLLEGERYVCISTMSTAECKHWDKWPELINSS